MTKIFKMINNAFRLKMNDRLLVGLLKIPFSLFFMILSIFVVYFVTLFRELNHYRLFLKDKDSHKTKGWKVEKVGNMIHSEYKDECSCGRKGCSKSVFEVIEKTIVETSSVM